VHIGFHGKESGLELELTVPQGSGLYRYECNDSSFLNKMEKETFLVRERESVNETLLPEQDGKIIATLDQYIQPKN